jgi:hypothetical protein
VNRRPSALRRAIALLLAMLVTLSSVEVLFGAEPVGPRRESDRAGTVAASGVLAVPGIVAGAEPSAPDGGQDSGCPCLCACACAGAQMVVRPVVEITLDCAAHVEERRVAAERPPLLDAPEPRVRPPLPRA